MRLQIQHSPQKNITEKNVPIETKILYLTDYFKRNNAANPKAKGYVF